MIELHVAGQSLKLRTPVVAADSLQYLRAKVFFTDRKWDGAAKWLHFRSSVGDNVYDLPLDEHNEITADQGLNLTVGEWTIYLTGTRDDTRLTTCPVVLTVKESGLIDAPLHELPMSVAEQLSFQIERLSSRIRELYRRAGLVVYGFYPDKAHLEEAVPFPYAGEAYAVGTAAPYNVWVWDGVGLEWVNAGNLVSTVAKGDQGVTFIPSVDENGIISWVNDGGRDNPEARDITGATGATGAAGPAGKSAYESAQESGYSGEEEAFNTALATLPEHHARHLPGGADPITVKTDNLDDGAVTADKLAADSVSRIVSVSIGTTWTGSAAPFTMEVNVSGLQATDRIVADIVPADDFEAAQQQMDAWASVFRIKAEDGKIILYASEQTTTAFKIQLMVVTK